MPVNPTYPGVYIEEVPSGVRTIMGVATSITAFIGRAQRGPIDKPVRVQSFAEYQRWFGSMWTESPMSYAVQQYFLNGGADAIILRVHNGASAATLGLPTAVNNSALNLTAANPGSWGSQLHAWVDYTTKDPADTTLFNLTVKEVDPSNAVLAEEHFLNLSVAANSPRNVASVLEQGSNLVRVVAPLPAGRPNAAANVAAANDGDDGDAIDADQVSNPDLQQTHSGLWLLDRADLFNILCIPPFAFDADVDAATWAAAKGYCDSRRAMLIVDPPSGWNAAVDVDLADLDNLRGANAALYFPRLMMADPLKENRLNTFAPCGAVAGIYARTDAQRGVWKAPAGQDATLLGVSRLAYTMTDGENGQLNPLGVNCLRTFPVTGTVVWGARTREGADQLASEWKYVPIRRLALFIEESLFRGTQWVVFEPNDEPLWAQIRLNVGAFMHNLFRQGAFQGTNPRDAYFVKCDKDTTTQADIDRGIVNIVVGFASLKPAEFVIIKIQQMAGEIQT